MGGAVPWIGILGCIKKEKTDPSVLVSFILTLHKLESSVRREPKLRKFLYKNGLQEACKGFS